MTSMDIDELPRLSDYEELGRYLPNTPMTSRRAFHTGTKRGSGGAGLPPLSIHTHLINGLPSPAFSSSPMAGVTMATSSYGGEFCSSPPTSSPLSSPSVPTRSIGLPTLYPTCSNPPPPLFDTAKLPQNLQATGPVSPPITPASATAKPTKSFLHLRNHTLHPLFAQRYVLGEELGAGGFGFVIAAVHIATHQEVAVKFIIRDKVPRHGWLRDPQLGIVPSEVSILARLKHGSVISMEDFYQDHTYFYLVMELHGSPWKKPKQQTQPPPAPSLPPTPKPDSGGSSWSFLSKLKPNSSSMPHAASTTSSSSFSSVELSSPESFYSQSTTNTSMSDTLVVPPRPTLMVRRPSYDLFECIETQPKFSEYQARHIFKQVVDAVYYLDTCHNIVHRDIKDENIVIDTQLRVKLIDFGSAVILPSSDGPNREPRQAAYFDRFYGTVNFAAPEILQGNSYRAEEAEIWSLGVLLFTIISGQVPFNDAYSNIDHTWPKSKVVNRVSRACVEVLDMCLARKARDRANVQQLMNAAWWTTDLPR